MVGAQATRRAETPNMKPLCLLTLIMFSGCQCLVPVTEDGGIDAAVNPSTDAGSDAGLDGGTDAGMDAGIPPSDAGCALANECTAGPQLTSNWCNTTQPDAGFSCVQNKCVWECPLVAAGRTCTVNQGTYCLECGDAGTMCPETTSCNAMGSVMATVESGSSCTTFTSVTVMRGASAQCRYFVNTNTNATGEIWRLPNGEYLAYFSELGGWCTGRSAFTGAPRSIFNCPACQFVLMGFE
jgi:hypothetical protein